MKNIMSKDEKIEREQDEKDAQKQEEEDEYNRSR